MILQYTLIIGIYYVDNAEIILRMYVKVKQVHFARKIIEQSGIHYNYFHSTMNILIDTL